MFAIAVLVAMTSSSYAVEMPRGLPDGESVIYGSDNRQEVADVTNPLYKKLAASTAAMIPANVVQDLTNGRSAFRTGTLRTDMHVCADERFANQITPAMCSGFLVGKDILVTAGHCITDAADCHNNRWVFDFRQDMIGRLASVPNTGVYKCSRVISRALDKLTKLDYAMIQLDRPVTDREPLKVRREGAVKLGEKLVVIGHPSGLPTKVSDGAFVRNTLHGTFFKANLDTFGGNSGSAVFNAVTGEVEGILVRGANDYKLDRNQGCYRVHGCGMLGCRGEDSTRITKVPVPAL